MMPEIERDGFDKVLKRVLKELKGKKVFISFDIDGIDPAYAPAVASQDIGGLTSIQAMRILRSVPIQNEVVAIEFTEYSPLFDESSYEHGHSGGPVDAHSSRWYCRTQEGDHGPLLHTPRISGSRGTVSRPNSNKSGGAPRHLSLLAVSSSEK